MTDIRRSLISTYFNKLPKTNNRIYKNQPFFFQRMMISSEKPSRLHMFFRFPSFEKLAVVGSGVLGFQLPEKAKVRGSRSGLPGVGRQRMEATAGGAGTVTVVAVEPGRVVSWWWRVAGFFGGWLFLLLVGKKGATPRKKGHLVRK